MRDGTKGALGARAENAVAQYLLGLGYELIGRNVRVGRYELDLVLRDGPVIAVVEVRMRGETSWLRPLDSIDGRKRARTRAAGEQLWQRRFARDSSVARMRFDVAGVTFRDDSKVIVEHVKAAF